MRGRFPRLADPERLVRDGRILVNGFPVTNPRSLVAPDASIVIRTETPLRGARKLAWALDHFEIDVAGRIALDVGAAAGGFTKLLLERGARRVYAVDVGFGQLLGSLRRDDRVVNLERTNLAEVAALVPERVGAITIDVSYVSVSAALPQLRVDVEPGADLIALVKPQFELGGAGPPDQPGLALALAVAGVSSAGWRVVDSAESPVRGAKGAVEFLVHARR